MEANLDPIAARAARARNVLKAAAIAIAAFWVYSPVIRGGWLWDDSLEISDNAVLRDPGGLAKIWIAPAGWDYYPLKTTLQWVQWHLWHGDTAGYHLANIGLHALSALLLWRLLWKLGAPLAWWGGMLFAVHPLAVESVAWISEFKNTLSLALVLLAMGAYVDFDARTQGGRRLPVLAPILFLAAMLSKSSVAMFPLVLLLYAWWRRGRITGRDLAKTAPFFVVAVVLGLVTVWFQHTRAIAGEYIPIGGPASRVAGAGLEIGFYFLKCVFPAGLMPIYPRLNLEPLSAVRFLPWVAIAAAAGWLWSRRSASWARGAAFALGSFAVNLVPVLGFIPMSYLRLSQVADHFAYLPLVSMAGLAAAGLGTWRRPPRDGGSPLRTRLPVICAAAACAALALESHRYAATFRSEAASVTYTLRHNPDSWFAHFRMGNILRTEGWTDEAMREYREALRIFPGSLEARSNLGNLLFQAKGRAEEAMVEYEEAIRIFPQSAEARCNLGNLLFAGGRTQEALAQFQEAVRLLPNYAAGQNGLAMALGAVGDLRGAAVHAELALRLDPDFPEAHNNLANMLLQMGRTDEAIAQYREALRLKPDFPEACNNLGVALSTAGRPTEAIAEFERAISLRPDYAEARRNLADTQARAGGGSSP